MEKTIQQQIRKASQTLFGENNTTTNNYVSDNVQGRKENQWNREEDDIDGGYRTMMKVELNGSDTQGTLWGYREYTITDTVPSVTQVCFDSL